MPCIFNPGYIGPDPPCCDPDCLEEGHCTVPECGVCPESQLPRCNPAPEAFAFAYLIYERPKSCPPVLYVVHCVSYANAVLPLRASAQRSLIIH